MTHANSTAGVSADPGDVEAITSVLSAYAEAGRRGDAEMMARVFRETAVIHGFIGGERGAGPIQLLYDWSGSNPPATGLSVTIAGIDVAGTVATVRLEANDWLGHRFTDQFTLLKENGAWTITSKVFHTH